MATLFLQVPELKIFTAILDSSLSHSTSKLWARSDPVNFCLSANTLVQIPIISCLDYCYHFLTDLIVTLALLQSSRQPKCHFHSKDMTKSLQQPESLICMTYSPPLFVQPLLVHSSLFTLFQSPGFLIIPWLSQAHSHLWTFALVILSVWNVLSLDIHIVHFLYPSSLCSDDTSMRSTLIPLVKIPLFLIPLVML